MIIFKINSNLYPFSVPKAENINRFISDSLTYTIPIVDSTLIGDRIGYVPSAMIFAISTNGKSITRNEDSFKACVYTPNGMMNLYMGTIEKIYGIK